MADVPEWLQHRQRLTNPAPPDSRRCGTHAPHTILGTRAPACGRFRQPELGSASDAPHPSTPSDLCTRKITPSRLTDALRCAVCFLLNTPTYNIVVRIILSYPGTLRRSTSRSLACAKATSLWRTNAHRRWALTGATSGTRSRRYVYCMAAGAIHTRGGSGAQTSYSSGLLRCWQAVVGCC